MARPNAQPRKTEPEPPKVLRRGPRRDYIFGLEGVRRALGLTQAELADRLGVTQGAVSQLEHGLAGEGDPQVSTLVRYAKALGGELEVRVHVGGRSYRVR